MKYKILWQSGPTSIRIFDDNNYAVCHNGKPKSYHNQPDSAVKAVCRTYADERCTDLTDWLEKYNTAMTWFAEQITGATSSALVASEAVKPISNLPKPPARPSGSESENLTQEK